jgi:hypothetical protein
MLPVAFIGILLGLVPVAATFYSANDDSFYYVGRWTVGEQVARSDWPCSGFRFDVTTTAMDGGATSIALKLDGLRLRVKVVVTADATGALETEILESDCIDHCLKLFNVTIANQSARSYTVSVTKLTQAAPYGNGLGRALTSVLEFHGVEMDTTNGATLGPPPTPSRRIGYVGASDTAGYCVDGTPRTNDYRLRPWAYDNCDVTSPGVLGRHLKAEISVQAIAGIGLTQNAFADMPALLGEETMPDYLDRTLQTNEQLLWNFTSWRPHLVVISLGGNDYNHQNSVPSNETFTAAYEDFILQIVEPYGEGGPVPTIVSICGQGDLTEVERDPNNDRCRPCPHVQDATEAFRARHGATVRTEYVLIPCDGSVVTGVDDIGCDGHKNQLGQERVANFLEPYLRDIMGWSDDTNDTSEDDGGSTAWAGVRVLVWAIGFLSFLHQML